MPINFAKVVEIPVKTCVQEAQDEIQDLYNQIAVLEDRIRFLQAYIKNPTEEGADSAEYEAWAANFRNID